MYSKIRLIVFFVAISLFVNILGMPESVAAAEVGEKEVLISHERVCVPLPTAPEAVIQARVIARSTNPTSAPSTTQGVVSGAQTPTEAESAPPAPLLNADAIFTLVNEKRAQSGLAPFQKDPQLCAVAHSRESQLASELSSGRIHAGFRALNLPYWATENMKLGSSESEVVSWWLNSPIHRKALLGTHTHSCATCAGKICIQLFTSFKPK